MRLKSFWSSSSVALCRRRRRRLDQEKRAFFSGRAATLLRVDFMLRETKGTRLAFFFPSHPISKRSTRDVTALSKEEEEEEDQSTQNRDTALLSLVSKPHERRRFFREEEEERKGCDERMRRRRVLTDDRNNRARRRFDGIWDPKKIEMGCPKERRKAFRNNAFWMWSPLFFFDNLSSAFGRRL